MSNLEALHRRAKALNLNGLLAHWGEAAAAGWLATLIDWEEQERTRRSLERRLRAAHIGRFKPLCDFDWTWPKRCDRSAFEALMALDFLKDATNAILVGPNGVGKSTLARNIAHQALIHGHTVLFTSAGQLLGDLASLDSDSTLRRRLHTYARPSLLVIDEVGYLSFSNRHADLLFELISTRYERRSLLITANQPFGEWNRVFSDPGMTVAAIRTLLEQGDPRAALFADGDWDLHELAGGERPALTVDEKDRAQLRQRVDDALHALVQARLVGADSIVGHSAYDFIDLGDGALDRLKDLERVLVKDIERTLDAIVGDVQLMAVIEPGGKSEQHKGQNNRCNHHQLQQSNGRLACGTHSTSFHETATATTSIRRSDGRPRPCEDASLPPH